MRLGFITGKTCTYFENTSNPFLVSVPSSAHKWKVQTRLNGSRLAKTFWAFDGRAGKQPTIKSPRVLYESRVRVYESAAAALTPRSARPVDPSQPMPSDNFRRPNRTLGGTREIDRISALSCDPGSF